VVVWAMVAIVAKPFVRRLMVMVGFTG